MLAGGESRRFGSDKAGALLGGKTLVERAAETLSQVFADVVVVTSRVPATDRWPVVSDAHRGRGPLAGIEAALAYASERGLDGAFVLACDMPLVDASTVRGVIGALEDGFAAAPVAEGAPGPEPLCAVYRVGCLPVVRAALVRGDLAAHGVLAAVGAATVALPADTFLNVNSPADHRRAADVLEGRAG